MNKRYAVFGHPIAHSLSPWIHMRFADLMGMAGLIYDKRLAPLDGFAQSLAHFAQEGGQGCNVTLPFKHEAFALAQTRSSTAELAQACNTLCRVGNTWEGHNTDGEGLLKDIEQAGVCLSDKQLGRLLILGAGGAVAGVLGTLMRTGSRQIVIANRTLSKAKALTDRLQAWAKTCQVDLSACSLDELALNAIKQDGFDLLINLTASSLSGQALALPAGLIRPGGLVYDGMYGPKSHAFLEWGQSQGAQTRDGLGMLLEQAAQAFQIWHGVRPPTTLVLQDLRAYLRQI